MVTNDRRLLIVDDDKQLVGVLTLKLQRRGYVVESATEAISGLDLARSRTYDLIVLDILMPKLNGLQICTELRASGVLTPILLLSGESDTEIVVQGLNAGADDYLTKPFQTSELEARVRALMRRHNKTFASERLERGGVSLDMPTNTVWYARRSLPLTPKEALLLRRLLAEAPAPVSRIHLWQDVWGIGSQHASNRLDVYVRRLRNKLRVLCGDECIHTIRGGGYYFGWSG